MACRLIPLSPCLAKPRLAVPHRSVSVLYFGGVRLCFGVGITQRVTDGLRAQISAMATRALTVLESMMRQYCGTVSSVLAVAYAVASSVRTKNQQISDHLVRDRSKPHAKATSRT